jgi:hypothetical protein
VLKVLAELAGGAKQAGAGGVEHREELWRPGQGEEERRGEGGAVRRGHMAEARGHPAGRPERRDLPLQWQLVVVVVLLPLLLVPL